MWPLESLCVELRRQEHDPTPGPKKFVAWKRFALDVGLPRVCPVHHVHSITDHHHDRERILENDADVVPHDSLRCNTVFIRWDSHEKPDKPQR